MPAAPAAVGSRTSRAHRTQRGADRAQRRPGGRRATAGPGTGRRTRDPGGPAAGDLASPGLRARAGASAARHQRGGLPSVAGADRAALATHGAAFAPERPARAAERSARAAHGPAPAAAVLADGRAQVPSLPGTAEARTVAARPVRRPHLRALRFEAIHGIVPRRGKFLADAPADCPVPGGNRGGFHRAGHVLDVPGADLPVARRERPSGLRAVSVSAERTVHGPGDGVRRSELL